MNEADFRLTDGHVVTRIDAASRALTVGAFARLPAEARGAKWRLLLDAQGGGQMDVLGGEGERALNNTLQVQGQALDIVRGMEEGRIKIREANMRSEIVLIYEGEQAQRGIMGSCTLNAEGLNLVPNPPLCFIQKYDAEGCRNMVSVFETEWNKAVPAENTKERLEFLSHTQPAAWVYYRTCYLLLDADEQEQSRLDKNEGIYDTKIWKMLFSYQKDGVRAMLEMLERHGGCILADSVGLGKTFEALAVIKYYELLDKKVLVLCPKRLEDNWRPYTQNSIYNPFDDSPFRYEVLFHSDLGRKGGKSNGRDLDSVRWGEYDLVVIDESHNFRNRSTKADKTTSRYHFLMEKVMKGGRKTKLLMLSATPVNNRARDLRNQVLLISGDDDGFLLESGIESVTETTKRAEKCFTEWANLPSEERSREKLIQNLNIDYFQLLNLVTIGRSRRHIKVWYEEDAKGVEMFPRQLPVKNEHPEAKDGTVMPVEEISERLKELNMAAYRPLKYVLPDYEGEYEKYDQIIEGKNLRFKQKDREKNLSGLIQMNLFKRMESSVHSFAATLKNLIERSEQLLDLIDRFDECNERGMTPEIKINDEELDNDDVEDVSELSVGKKVRVKLSHIDQERWRNDITADLGVLKGVRDRCDIERDAKLNLVRRIIRNKLENPINEVDGKPNRKIIIFTAFTDTAEYLYGELAKGLEKQYGIYTALITGSSKKECNLPGLKKKNQETMLAAFSPVSKKGFDAARHGGHEIDVLIATDCISEGQNLQGCDFLINYDIHWNPVRIIQRFGRIDRIGSPNKQIQLVNIWPMPDLNAYINLEGRVRARLELVNVSATEADFREKQLRQLQEGKLDMDSMDQAYAISDLSMQPYRTDLAKFREKNKGIIEGLPSYFTATLDAGEAGVSPGAFFLLRSSVQNKALSKTYPFGNQFLLYVGEDGKVIYEPHQIRDAWELLRKIASKRTEVDATAEARYLRQTKQAHEMRRYTQLLDAAVRAISGQEETSRAASIFDEGITLLGRDSGARSIDDVEVLAMLILTRDEG